MPHSVVAAHEHAKNVVLPSPLREGVAGGPSWARDTPPLAPPPQGAGNRVRRAVVALLVALLSIRPLAAETPRSPVAERKPVTKKHFGVTLTDDYAWMRTRNLEVLLQKPEALEAPIRRHLDAEARYARAVLAPNRELEQQLLAEMKARVRQDDEAVPEGWGPWEYYTRFAPGSQRKLHCRRPRGGGPEQVLLDENVLARGRRAFSVTESTPSFDHALLSYAVDEDGSERNIVRVRDLATGRDLPDAIPDVRGGAVWSHDRHWLFYVRRDPTKWGRQVFRHRLGTPVSQDVLVYEEKQEGFSVSVRSTLSDRFLVIETGDFSTSDVHVLDLSDPTGVPKAVSPRKEGEKFAFSDLGDRVIFLTNADGATDWKIAEKPLAAPADAPLTDIVDHKPGRLLEDAAVFREHLVWLERDRDRGRQQIRVRRWSDGAEHAIAFDDAPAKLEILAGLEQSTRTLRFAYQTLAQPRQVFDYDLETRQRTLRKVNEVPGGHDAGRYVTRRSVAPAKDGAEVPVTLFYRKDIKLDGSAPVWLHGYGAYGDTEHPEFSPERLSLVDRGFIYAIAHVRGGGEKGEPWHEAGRLLTKRTTFTDYIAVAEHLVAQGLTRPGLIVASGASAGGTLVGAVANMRPGLFAGIYAEVPFVDVVNTLLDRSLPLTESSFSEFGNPIESAADFRNLLSYSPYDNVRAQAYPPMLVTASLNDSRVPYWEAAKWVAKLRRMKTDANAVVLYINMRGGHGGATGRFEVLEDFARAYAFGLQVAKR
jgi:oligopeptidase B